MAPKDSEQRDVTAAEATAKAREASAQADDLERAALDEGADVDAAEVDEARTAARHWGFKAQIAARREKRQAAAERAAALAELHNEIRAAAAAVNPAVFGEALTATVTAWRHYTELVNEQNDLVGRLVERARALGCTGPAPGGPKAGDGHVAIIGGNAIQAGHVILRPADSDHSLVERVINGEPVQLPGAVVTQPEPHRPGAVYVSKAGAFFPMDGAPGRGTLEQLGDGRLVALTEAEIDRFMRGELEDLDEAELERRRVRQQRDAGETERRKRAAGAAQGEKALADLERAWQ